MTKTRLWLVRGLFAIFVLAISYRIAGHRGPELTAAFLAGFSVHFIWDIIVLPIVFSLGWYAKGRRQCHPEHRPICCQNPRHGGQE